jgi:hypothetical protein
MKRYIALIAAGLALVAASGAAASSTIPTVKIHCAYIQGGAGVSRGDLNVYRKGAVKRFCFVGARGMTGATGPAGPAGKDGSISGSVAVCASNGGNLKLCGGDNGHDPVGYLVLAK